MKGRLLTYAARQVQGGLGRRRGPFRGALKGQPDLQQRLMEQEQQLKDMGARLRDRAERLASLGQVREELDKTQHERNRLLQVVEVLSEKHGYVVPLPPEELRLHVGTTTSAANFLIHGLLSSRRVLEVFGHEPTGPILDWGCGSGRTLRWLHGHPSWRRSFYGCDVDADAIAWLKSLGDFNVQVCSDDPPLPYPDELFQGVFAFSVLTHIHPQAHRGWYLELARILAPGGIAYLTTQGAPIVFDPSKGIPKPQAQAFQDQGWTYIEYSGHHKNAALVSERYTRGLLGGLFDVLSYKEKGYGNMDAFIVQRAGSDVGSS